MTYSKNHVRDLAKSYIDLLEYNRVSSFDEWCRNRGGFLAEDYHRIKTEVKKLLESRPCQTCGKERLRHHER